MQNNLQEVEHRLVLICWIDNNCLCTLHAYDGARRYQKDHFDPRIALDEGSLEYYFDPVLAVEAMCAGKKIQLEWRAYEDVVSCSGKHLSGFSYSNSFDAELIHSRVPNALKPYTEQQKAKVSDYRKKGLDPTVLDVSP